jgi:hypothetical protein
MLRQEWKFDYTASTLAEAAHTKRQFHQERFNWWTKRASAPRASAISCFVKLSNQNQAFNTLKMSCIAGRQL